MLQKNKSIFVISAPSGTGKTTIAQRLNAKIPGLEVIVSYTTRKPRPGEKNGINYHFVTRERFRAMIEEDRFAEWAEVYGNYYGTPKKEILRGLAKNKKILLTIDTQGGMSIKKKLPGATLIAVMPPSIREQEKRIRKRKGLTEIEIKERVESARKEKEILMKEYHFRLINKNLENTVKKICNIINKGSKY
jgi:guanylate kinase